MGANKVCGHRVRILEASFLLLADEQGSIGALSCRIKPLGKHQTQKSAWENKDFNVRILQAYVSWL